MTPQHEEWDELLAGHALDALEPEDEHRLLDHAAGCETCSQTLRVFQEVAADLARALPAMPPPEGGKQRLLAALADGPVAPPAAVPPEPRSAASAREPEAERAPAVGVIVPRPAGRARDRFLRRGTAALAAAAVAVVVAAGAVVYGWRQHDMASNRSSKLASAERMLHDIAAGHRMVALASGDGARGQVVQNDGHVWVLAAGLTPNDTETSTYVLWATEPDGHMMPVTTFDVGSDRFVALGDVALPAATQGSPAFAISEERGRTAPAVPSTPVLSSQA